MTERELPDIGAAPPPSADQPVTSDDVQALRDITAQAVALDGRRGGAELLPAVTSAFRAASARSAPAGLETDFTAAAAELGQVAGWLAFDSLRHDEARRLDLRALRLARLAGDARIERFLLGNMALLAQEAGRPRESLRIVDLLELSAPSPRVRVMAALRRARALADLGDQRALDQIHRAQSQADESITRADPEWTWWLDRRELVLHEGGIWRALGRPDEAVDRYAAALEDVPDAYPWSAYVGGSWLVGALVEARSWSEADTAANELARLARDVSSGRATQRLREASATARALRAPSSLQDLLTALAG
ncbi:hypothetical protein [Saccharopolyspora tripterygii]